MNVPAIETFVNDINTAIGGLIEIREDLHAIDRLWAVTENDVVALRAAVNTKLTAAKAQVQALTVP